MITPKAFEHPEAGKYIGNNQSLIELSSRMRDGFYIFDQKTLDTVYANRSILNVLGYSVEKITELGSEWIKKVVHPDDFAILSRHIAHYTHLKNGQRTRVVYRVIDADDKYRVVETSAVLIDANDGNLILGVSRIIESQQTDLVNDKMKINDHRCTNCEKLLGKDGMQEKSVEVKCSRCGEYNTISLL